MPKFLDQELHQVVAMLTLKNQSAQVRSKDDFGPDLEGSGVVKRVLLGIQLSHLLKNVFEFSQVLIL